MELEDAFGYSIWPLVKRGHGPQVLPPEQVYAAAHFAAAKGVLFVVRERLLDALAETDLPDDYPTGGIRGPFPDCYFHFEKPLSNETGNDAITIEGFYVSEEVEAEDEVGPEQRRLTILPVMSDADRAIDISSVAMQIYCADGDGNVLKDRFRALDESGGKQGNSEQAKQAVEFFKGFLKSMVKVLLYTTLHDQRRRDVKDRSEAMEQARAKQGKERQKLMDKAARLYDYISIGPESDDQDDCGLATGSGRHGVKPHVRRGSYVSQPWGPNNSLRRNQWRRPTIVHRGDGPEPETKVYLVN